MSRATTLLPGRRKAAFDLGVLRRAISSLDLPTIAAFALPFSVYVLTAAPTIYNLDSAEFTTAAATGGIVRATGYPLYLLLGRLWTWLPIGDVGYRMNLFSAFAGALTVALAERILRRLNVGLWPRLAALGLLATAPFFWALSLIAEVYTLHTALMAAIILLLLRWSDEPTPQRLSLVALAVGLSAGNHAATALLLPGIAWYVITVAGRRALAPRALLLSVAGLSAGLAVYLYLPLRYAAAPSFNYAGHYTANGVFVPVDLTTPGGLLWLVSGRAFTGEMLAYSPSQLWRETLLFTSQLWRAFFAIGVGPGLLGMVIMLRRDWRRGGMLLLMFLFSVGFYIDYRVVDKDTMFLPAYLIWALWLGVGYEVLRDSAVEKQGRLARRLAASLLQGVMVVGVLAALVWNWPLVDLSNDWSTRQRGETILRLAEPDALVLGWWDTVPVIQYLQLVDGQRPDVQAMNRFLISRRDMLRLIEREVPRRAVYIDSPPTDLPAQFRTDPVGPVYRLRPRQRDSDSDVGHQRTPNP